MEKQYTCPHGVKAYSKLLLTCCKCRYGERSHFDRTPREKDISELISQNVGKRLSDGFEIMGEY